MAAAAPAKGSVAPAPQIRGLRYIRPLGSGGTCWVYLYQQAQPQRPVAVKVSKRRANRHSHELFLKEATFMARLSEHPYILSIYAAGVSADGHDYIVMEYAPGGNFKRIMKTSQLGQEQALDLGVRIASALYTAHQQGIIHRDVKPGNVLVTADHLPVLADFGISASTYQAAKAKGLSIPWAAPEVIAHKSGGSEASDIYSLGATLFGLLAGKSPYEYAFRVHSEEELAQAIMEREAPHFLRQEAAEDFERVLRKAMAHDREERYFSALDFARDMQVLQNRLYQQMTPLIAQDADLYPTSEELGIEGRLILTEPGAGLSQTGKELNKHRSKLLASARGNSRPAQAQASPTRQEETQASTSDAGNRLQRVKNAPQHQHDQAAGQAQQGTQPPAHSPYPANQALPDELNDATRPAFTPGQQASDLPDVTRQSVVSRAQVLAHRKLNLARRVGLSALSCLLAAVLATGLGVATHHEAGESVQTTTSSQTLHATASDAAGATDQAPAASTAVPPVSNGRGHRQDGHIQFTWSNPDPQPGDSYLWEQIPADQAADQTSNWQGAHESSQASVSIAAESDQLPCIRVALQRANHQLSTHSTTICAPKA
uniref:non-specific serine/threonine protein kinase n=1 Tax=Bombiscardovia nodaiensis TaxID=2932181 RepID=A0ABM8B938_9BIFI|nr:hypothetical protein KIM372_13190 [Bombiscardovia nodaiensis]